MSELGKRLSILTVTLLLVGGGASASALAQGVPVAPAPDQLVIESGRLGERRPVLVFVPESYTRTHDRYPVLVVVDGDGPGATQAMSVVNRLADLTRGSIPELIVVTIPNFARSRDLVPAHPSGKARGSDGEPALLDSHADRFLGFIEHELLPEVDRRYRTHPVRFLHGSSYGGLFGIFAFVTRPQLFRGIIAGSPSFWVDKQVWVDSLLASLTRRPSTKQWLYVSAAEFDHPLITGPMPRVHDALLSAAPTSLRWRVDQLAGRDHQSADYAAMERGLSFMFEDFAVPYPTLARISAGELRAHYRGLTESYGWPVGAPMWAFNRQLLTKDLTGRPMADVLATGRALLEDYWWHPYAYDAQTWFLGSSPEETSRAIAHLEDAVRVAKASGYWTGEYEASLAEYRKRVRRP
jgi:predicted alpha/beta superfamily hydrolase